VFRHEVDACADAALAAEHESGEAIGAINVLWCSSRVEGGGASQTVDRCGLGFADTSVSQCRSRVICPGAFCPGDLTERVE